MNPVDVARRWTVSDHQIGPVDEPGRIALVAAADSTNGRRATPASRLTASTRVALLILASSKFSYAPMATAAERPRSASPAAASSATRGDHSGTPAAGSSSAALGAGNTASLGAASFAGLNDNQGDSTADSDTPRSADSRPVSKVFDLGGATLFEKGTFAIEKGVTLRGDRYFFGKHAEIDGTLDGDFFGYAESASVMGTITGDFNTGGRWAKIQGPIGDDVRFAGEDLQIGGPVGGDLLAVAKEIRVQRGASVGGITLVGGGVVTLSGEFDGAVHASAGKITFDGTAMGNVTLNADVIEFKPSASIKGNLTYTARNAIAMFRDQTEEGRKIVAGTVTYNPAPSGKKTKHGFFGFFGWIWFVATFVGAYVVGALIIAIARGMVTTIVKTAQGETLKSLGFGVLGHIFAPFAGCILIGLCLTFPVGILVLMAWAMLFYISKLVVSLALADGVLGKLGFKPSPYLSLLIGLVALWVLFMVPVLGALLKWFIVPIFGIGAILAGVRAYSVNARVGTAPASEAGTSPAL